MPLASNSAAETLGDYRRLAGDMPRAWGDARNQGRIRCRPEDFRVQEIPVCRPDGAGEHLWLRVRKTGQNTDWVAQRLAGYAGVAWREVGYAGLKDRHAVTEQWFSIHLPGRATPDWQGFDEPGIEVLEVQRHARKLRRGALQGNAFQLRLRGVEGERSDIERRLKHIADQGFPSYFGHQRFGRDAGNLARAEALFAGHLRRVTRTMRSLYLSAARSLLFNRVLAERVRQANWDRALAGDVLQLDGRSACFCIEAPDDAVRQRLARLEVHPTGPLWGRGRSLAAEACRELEARCLDRFGGLRAGLEAAGMKAERRALRARAERLSWCWPEPGVLDLRFRLPAGTYATVLLRELGEFTAAPMVQEDSAHD
jgi:tRNA pseudouridine13 synthase